METHKATGRGEGSHISSSTHGGGRETSCTVGGGGGGTEIFPSTIEKGRGQRNLPRNLSNHMDRQACTRDTVLVKSREMTGRSQTLPWWLGGGRVKTTETKIHWTRW